MFKFQYKKDACPIAPKEYAAAAKGAKAVVDAVKGAAGIPKGTCDAVAEGKAAACKRLNLNKAGCAAAPDCSTSPAETPFGAMM